MSASNYTETEWMKYAFTATAMGTRPTAWYLAVHTADPGEDGTTSECAYSGYARQSIAFTQTANQVVSNNQQTFGAVAGGAQTITHFSVGAASFGDKCLFVGALCLGKAFSVGDVPKFGTGEVILSVD